MLGREGRRELAWRHRSVGARWRIGSSPAGEGDVCEELRRVVRWRSNHGEGEGELQRGPRAVELEGGTRRSICCSASAVSPRQLRRPQRCRRRPAMCTAAPPPFLTAWISMAQQGREEKNGRAAGHQGGAKLRGGRCPKRREDGPRDGLCLRPRFHQDPTAEVCRRRGPIGLGLPGLDSGPCLDPFKVPTFYILSPLHQFWDTCMEQ
jgi:hypothetical protein